MFLSAVRWSLSAAEVIIQHLVTEPWRWIFTMDYPLQLNTLNIGSGYWMTNKIINVNQYNPYPVLVIESGYWYMDVHIGSGYWKLQLIILDWSGLKIAIDTKMKIILDTDYKILDKHTKSYWTLPWKYWNFPLNMAIFNSKLLVCQRVPTVWGPKIRFWI